MNSKRTRYIVIRVSNVDTRNVTEEIKGVIAEKGHAWFGKYGRPVKGVARSAQEYHRVVILQRRRSQVGSYEASTFLLTGYSRTVPIERNYPLYYKEVLHKIRTWFRLEPAPQYEQVGIWDLEVISSATPLSFSLRNSMSSNFVCRLKKERIPSG